MTKNTLLLEIVCEELPARFCVSLSQKLGDFFDGQINNNEGKYRLCTDESYQIFSTPRRLAISIPLDANAYVAQTQSLKGPPLEKCFTDVGLPSNALIGFCRRQGINLDDQQVMDVKQTILASFNGANWDYSGAQVDDAEVVLQHDKGRLLIEQSFQYSPYSALQNIVAALPQLLKELNNTVDRTMRDGDNYRFPRPLQRVLVMLDDQAWDIPLAALTSNIDMKTAVVLDSPLALGHRNSPAVVIEHAQGYQDYMLLSGVVADRDLRKRKIVEQLDDFANALFGKSFTFDQHNQKLLEEVVDLVEHPKVIQCKFPEIYLDLPEKLTSCVLVEQQRYFWLGLNGDGDKDCIFFVVTNLADKFSEHLPALNNARMGHQKVVSPRLADALFYYRADLEKGLPQMSAELNSIMFHKALGSYAEKNARINNIAQKLCHDLQPNIRNAIAAFRADRASQTVNQFTSLEGYMLQHFYMLEQPDDQIQALLHLISSGISNELWERIQAVYKTWDSSSYPLQSIDLCQVKYAQNWQIFLIDRLDTLLGLIHSGADFSSSRDPFGLRRVIREIAQALFILSALAQFGSVPFNTDDCLDYVLDMIENNQLNNAAAPSKIDKSVIEAVKMAIVTRSFTIWQVDARISNALGYKSSNLGNQIGMIQKAKTLTHIVQRQDFQNLIELYKRALNIISKNTAKLLPDVTVSQQYSAVEQELHLTAVLNQVEQEIKHNETSSNLVVLTDSYRKIQQPLADFFEHVMVIDSDPIICAHRLKLLQKVVELPVGWLNFRALISGDNSVSQSN